ncbi:carbon-nitrogen hydrolase family protein [Aspergillus undulatus]|uniref:carbon-nitrogen hydrolase family protein n=1 Tax=Aspergillus undulatus TaxID=1810928 RepID=UPI003CCDB686
MSPTRRVAVIQWAIKNLAGEQNHATACEYIRSAAAQGAELAVLPEYHLTGWAPEDPLFATQAEQTVTANYLSAYQSLAKELNICLVPGTIVEKHPHPNLNLDPKEQEGDKHAYVLYNTAYFISNTGEILGRYRKKNIWHPEREYLTSSAAEPHEVFDTPVGKVGLLICWDVAFPEAFRELISNGAEVVVVPTYWGRSDASPAALQHNANSEALFLDTTLTARCFENTCAVIFANYAGTDQSLGMSRIVLPIVGPVAKMENEEGVLVGDMNMELVRLAEENYKVRMDLGREGWYYFYRHSLTGADGEP